MMEENIAVGAVSFSAWTTLLYKYKHVLPPGASGAEQDLIQLQTAAFGAVLVLNVLNLLMRQHLLPFKCNLLLLFINAVAFTTDLLIWRGYTPIVMSTSGRPFAPLRYIQWCHSTPTMIYMVALLADAQGWQLLVPLVADVAMVVTGLAACVTSGWLQVAMTVASFGTFGVVVHRVHGMFLRTLTCERMSPEQRTALHTLLAVLLGLWTAFPAVWVAAQLNLISQGLEAVCWGICDYAAKVVFSSQLWQSNLTASHQRREGALQAWESSNRAEAVARLGGLLRERDDLLATLSHELRTPLAGIVALTGILHKDVSAALPSASQTLAAVRATATCMLNIVSSTLTNFGPEGRNSSSNTGGGSPEVKQALEAPAAEAPTMAASVVAAAACSLQLQPLAETVTSILRPLARDGVAVVCDVPRGLPLVAADPTTMSQVLYNLVGNALRFTFQGQVRVTARVVLPPPPEGEQAQAGRPANVSRRSLEHQQQQQEEARSRKRWSGSTGSSAAESCEAAAALPAGALVQVCVEDTGQGLRQERLDALLGQEHGSPGEAVRASRASRSPAPPLPLRRGSCNEPRAAAGTGGAGSYEGTGLGLYLVRLALQSQGTQLEVESAEGVGSRFRFTLRVATGPGAAPAAPGAGPVLDQQACTPAAAAAPASGVPPLHVQPSVQHPPAPTLPPVTLRPLHRRTSSSDCGPDAARTSATASAPSSARASTPRPSAFSQTPASSSTAAAAASIPGRPARDVLDASDAALVDELAVLAAANGSVASAASVSAPGTPAAAAVVPRQLSYRHRHGGQLQVLSVDDDPINQLVAGQMLTSQSWKVVRCMNGMEALAQLQLSDADQEAGGAQAGGGKAVTTVAGMPQLPPVLPDCVLLDLMMPGMSGFDVCKRLRARFTNAQLPVIMVSAKTDAPAVEEAFACGADDYMTKPYKRAEMVARIKAQIRIRDTLPAGGALVADGGSAGAAVAGAKPALAGSAAAAAGGSHLSRLAMGSFPERPASTGAVLGGLMRPADEVAAARSGPAGPAAVQQIRSSPTSPAVMHHKWPGALPPSAAGAAAPAAAVGVDVLEGVPLPRSPRTSLDRSTPAHVPGHSDVTATAAPSALPASETPHTGSSGGGPVSAAIGGPSAAAMLEQVLAEVRRSKSLDAEVARLNAKLSSLRATCASLAADRDAWRRQCRELRALFAAGVTSTGVTQTGVANGGGGGGGGGGSAASLPTLGTSRMLLGSCSSLGRMAAAAANGGGDVGLVGMPGGGVVGVSGSVTGLTSPIYGRRSAVTVEERLSGGTPRAGLMADGYAGAVGLCNGNGSSSPNAAASALTADGSSGAPQILLGARCLNGSAHGMTQQEREREEERGSGGAGAGAGGGGAGSTRNAACVLDELEELRKEAATLRQQMSFALANASVGAHSHAAVMSSEGMDAQAHHHRHSHQHEHQHHHRSDVSFLGELMASPVDHTTGSYTYQPNSSSPTGSLPSLAYEAGSSKQRELLWEAAAHGGGGPAREAPRDVPGELTVAGMAQMALGTVSEEGGDPRAEQTPEDRKRTQRAGGGTAGAAAAVMPGGVPDRAAAMAADASVGSCGGAGASPVSASARHWAGSLGALDSVGSLPTPLAATAATAAAPAAGAQAGPRGAGARVVTAPAAVPATAAAGSTAVATGAGATAGVTSMLRGGEGGRTDAAAGGPPRAGAVAAVATVRQANTGGSSGLALGAGTPGKEKSNANVPTQGGRNSTDRSSGSSGNGILRLFCVRGSKRTL